jgi:hypothetical protein
VAPFAYKNETMITQEKKERREFAVDRPSIEISHQFTTVSCFKSSIGSFRFQNYIIRTVVSKIESISSPLR